MDRRTRLAARVAFAAAVLPARSLRALETIMEEDHPQYGLIGQMIAQPGQRGALAAILTEGTDAMPGNFAYIVGEDAENTDRSEEHTSELQSLMRISYAVFCLTNKINN